MARCWRGLAAFLLQSSLLRLGELMAGLLLGVLLKPLFSWRMLRCEVVAVEAELERSLHAGQLQLGRLVSRDVAAPHACGSARERHRIAG